MKARLWRHARQAAQALALLLFLYLALETRQGVTPALPHDLFFRLDPLAGLAAMLAGRRWIVSLALGLATLALAVAAGRAWCGWLCPMGTVLDWTRLQRTRTGEKDLPAGWRQVKHVLLLVILFAALWGNLTLLVLDPITLLFRTVAVAVLPALDVLVTGAERTLYALEPLRDPLLAFDGLVRGTLLPTEPRLYELNVLLALVFAGVVALNAVRLRFWCRSLCPLGALLGLVSKVSVLRQRVDGQRCVACGRCARVCPTGAVQPERGYAADPGECVLCLDCWETCPKDAIAFRGQVSLARWARYDPSRRQALASLGLATLGVALLNGTAAARREDPWLVLPPGARENDLPGKCIRCGECVKVCPTAGLQPSLSTAGWPGVWTPVLVSRLGYCDYSCNSCGQVCPTGAIPPLSLEEKRQAVIGVAAIDRSRCIPWNEARDCIVCEEMCPLPAKAILLEDQTGTDALGNRVRVRLPRVVPERCIGCGICEHKCPLGGEAAIRVSAPRPLRSGRA
ncbi:MAG: 4Fe-4S binding protein [Chloroflexi bacterium]|nr:4Fe-4S binding protein [Chloroflexota bacterium]